MDIADGESLLHRRTFCLVTGASRGIGKCLAQKLAQNFAQNSLLVLVARTREDLMKTKDAICLSCAASAALNIVSVVCDLADCDQLSIVGDALNSCLNQATDDASSNFDVALIVNNAGSLGDISKKGTELSSYVVLKNYFDLNLHSFILLTNMFLKTTEKHAKKQVVINITSLLAVKPLPAFSLYATGKAAREVFLGVLATEQPEIRILNYSPGPVATDMQMEIEKSAWNVDIKRWVENLRKTGGALTCEQTVDKLLKILEINKFDNASHVDFYDKTTPELNSSS